MREYKLPARTLFLWRIRTAVLCLLLLFACTFLKFKPYIAIIAGGIIIALYLIAVLWYLPQFFKSCKISYLNGAVIIKRGIIIKNTHILPFSRLIYTQTLTTPLSKALGLTAVSLKAARSRIFVPEISKNDARELIKALSEGGEL